MTPWSKNAKMYAPPQRPQRPFEADYPGGARADETGRLTHDIEGRPLTADYVVGRRMVGGPDEAVPQTPEAINAIAEGLFGSRISPVARREIGGDAGRFTVSAGPDGPTGVL